MSVEKQTLFFNYLFKGFEGFVCISSKVKGTRQFSQEFFKYPDQVEVMINYIQKMSPGHDMYYCSELFVDRKCRKESAIHAPALHADLDACDPDKMLVQPSIVIETSINRYQALWRLDQGIPPVEAEDASRRIAYRHAEEGADKTGWDITQRLRVPFTYNYKYDDPQMIKILTAKDSRYSLDAFTEYPVAEGYEYTLIPFPDELPPKTSAEILDFHKAKLSGRVWTLYSTVPGPDQKEGWSGALWNLQLLLIEAGMSREEAFIVARDSKCNKYKRDNRSQIALWKETCRAYEFANRARIVGPAEPDPQLPPLLTDWEREVVERNPSIVEEYISWAKELGDAAWQYHQAGAFIVLSTILAGAVRLPTSFGTVLPNLWFMILADTTLTRKTTAMDIAMDMVLEVDPDCVLATDGSIEGLMTSLSLRPGRPSVFLRDEFSGLLESMVKKDYYAGMAETFTKLYDGKFQKRILRKETIEVRNPILILFAGGIRSRIMELLTYEHVASGFIPRFVFVTAESDVTRLRPLGPPTDKSQSKRDDLLKRLMKLRSHYTKVNSVTIDNKTITTARTWDAKLTPEAWARYNVFESAMLEAGLRMQQSDITTPTFDRLAKSGLKAAVLLAASRQLPDEEVIVELDDIIRAFYYVEGWREHAMEVIRNVGKTTSERSLERITKAVHRHPGVSRSTLMQHYRLSARDAESLFTTLEQRGLVERRKSGRQETLWPTNITEEELQDA